MATSSIFHAVKIDTPEKAEAFVAALEASQKDPWRALPERAIDFAKRKLSISHIVFDDADSQILGYFTLTHREWS
ncbi:MAG: hypothetical protein ACTTK0_09290 [Stomatobaculum sp.]